LTIRVADTGIGLSAEQQARLFKPFTQADDTHHRYYGGTGLGLVICQRLAALLQGSITLQSKPGEGSTFTVQLPVEIAPAPGLVSAPLTPARAASPLAPSSARRILIADDAVDNRRLLHRLLTRAGYTVQVTDDGSTALGAVLAGPPPDLILMDMQMPTVDGYQATSELRKLGYTGPIFALTAFASTADEEKCRHAGCDGYIAKPFDCELLLSEIQSVLDTSAPAPVATR